MTLNQRARLMVSDQVSFCPSAKRGTPSGSELLTGEGESRENEALHLEQAFY